MSQKKLPDEVALNIAKAAIQGDIGYRQPPRHSQFKKGQSGNPRGRPRKVQYQAPAHGPLGVHTAEIERVLAEPVSVLKDGRKKKISKAEFVQRSLEKQAAEGRYYSARRIEQQLYEADKAKAQAIEEDHAFWRDYLKIKHEAQSAHGSRGEPSTGFWIADEDIEFGPGKPVKVRGPVLVEEIGMFDLLARFRDVLMIDLVCMRLLDRESRKIENPGSSAVIGKIQEKLTKQQEREGDAYFDSLNKIHPRFWLLSERERVWARFGLRPQKRFVTGPEMPKALLDVIRPAPNSSEEFVEGITERLNQRNSRRRRSS